jgi:RNA polymerase sigma factor (TIGR02999 family)
MASERQIGSSANTSTTTEVTRLLQAAADGNAQSSEELLALVYDQLRAIARQRMAGERASHTLQATALVHEAYIRLLGREGVRWNGRGHFFLAAAEAMRRILIDHARARNAGKRKGERAALDIVNVAEAVTETDLAGVLALDDAMSRLEKLAPETAAIVRLRFYAGLSVEAVAEALGVSARTVKREWAFGRAWLRGTLTRGLNE